MAGFMSTKAAYKVVKEMAKDWDRLVLTQSTFSCGFLSSRNNRTRIIRIIDIPNTEEKNGISSRNMLNTFRRLLNLQIFVIVLQ